MDLIEVQDNHKFNYDNLYSYLKINHIILEDIIEIKQFVHGQSNPTFLIICNDLKLVLRKKPPGKLLKSAHMIDREFKIISALFLKNFPVPKPIIYCEDISIIGTEFYITEFVDGKIIRDIRLNEYSPEERYHIYTEYTRVANLLHSFDPDQMGLSEFGRKGNYYERQLSIWTKQYRETETENINEMNFLVNWLPKNIPGNGYKNRIVHGDLRLENIIFDKKENKILAVLDWELSTIGDPITDIAYFCLSYHLPVELMGLGNFDKGFYGIPSEIELKSLYFGDSIISNWEFYIAFNCFRLSAICQGVYKRSILGNASSTYANTFIKKTKLIAKTGQSVIEKKSYNFRRDNSLFNMLSSNLTDNFFILYEKLKLFMDYHIYPNERKIFLEREKYGFSKIPSIIEKLKTEAKNLGLWNLFIHSYSGLSNLEYAFLCEIMGRSTFLAPEIFNCSAPDTGNMELLHKYSNQEQKEKYLMPLLNGEIRSCFAMTEKGIASSDATNIKTTIIRNKDNYIINGRKWWISGAGDPRCKFAIVMGLTPDKSKSIHNQHSMIIVPLETQGVRIIRPMKVFGYDDAPHGHMDIIFDNVKVPLKNLIMGEGKGFEMAQGRLGPGRIHHCMRLLGMAERALDNILDRVTHRKVFSKLLSKNDYTIKEIANCRTKIDQARLLVIYTAFKIDTSNSKRAKDEIAMIKIVVPKITIEVIEKAMQIYGAEGFSQDTFLAISYSFAKTLRIADGPDEVHMDTLGKSLINQFNPKF